jgi:uncharacterized protein YbgA (DUF1722 family)/uncharacterized protein YbbK (DUF523 family)
MKPIVLISKCIEFDHCRYDGSMIASDFVKKIKPFIQVVTVCPEMKIGLGVPRKSLRLVVENNEKRLIQPVTDKDVTDKMIDFAQGFLSDHSQIHGVILKSRSPSCGIKDVKLYSGRKNAAPVKRVAGLFGEQVLKKMNCLVETEGRLRNTFIQEHFLTSMFTLADFEQVKREKKISDLVSFHAKNKFLFMAYNQELLRKMGNIAANQEKKSVESVLHDYEQSLFSLFDTPPSHKSTVNVLLHLFGFISDNLSKPEKEFFLHLIKKYKNEKITLNVLTQVLKSWVIRFAEPYLSQQTFFSPFPEELFEENISAIADRPEYWK